MKRYKSEVVGEPELVLDLLRTAIAVDDSDRFRLDTGLVPGTRSSTGWVEGRLFRVEGGIRVVAKTGRTLEPERRARLSRLWRLGLVPAVVFPLALLPDAWFPTWMDSLVRFAVLAPVTVVLAVVGSWSLAHRISFESKAADHALRHLEERVAEVRELLRLHTTGVTAGVAPPSTHPERARQLGSRVEVG